MIKTIIFDIGNVLLHFSHDKMLLRISEKLELSFAELKRKFLEEGLIHAYESGNLNTHQFFESLVGKTADFTFLRHAMEDIFDLNEPMETIVHSLKRQNKRLLLLSNTNEVHFNYIHRHFPLLQKFDKAILSFEIKSSKPQAPIYQEALKEAQCLPYECFYIDDILGHVAAARSLGMDAIHYKSVGELKKELANRMIFV